MDGGGLAILPDRIVTAWRREHEIFLASPGMAETPIGSGRDVSITAGEHGLHAVWTSPNGSIQALIPGSPPVTIAPKGAFPNLVALPDGRDLAAWEIDGRISVQIIP